MGGLINLVATIPFEHESLKAKDILGHVYEYFLGQFALAEGKKGGQYFTPKSIVSLIVEMIEPYQGLLCIHKCKNSAGVAQVADPPRPAGTPVLVGVP